jgi:two-component system nitrogen regulation response regulator GlnG
VTLVASLRHHEQSDFRGARRTNYHLRVSDEATVPRQEFARSRVGTVPMLTVIGHPDPERVPSQLRLVGTVALSRTSPNFTQLSDGHPRPLGDRYLSRSPIAVKPEGDSVWLFPNEKIDVEADGRALSEPTRFDREELERGVVLLLSGRVVLLLHLGSERPPQIGRELGLIGCSSALARVRDDIRMVGDLPVPVLIRGESGTGKELIAGAIHRESPRANRHYEALNMATLSPALAASELFGHVRGAFTGADRNHDGCFVRADGGTLFLDEIGETPIDTQAQLLRVLETRDVRPVGGSITRRVDVRVIAATDADLESAVRQGGFREALLQRLAGFRIVVPPLRERRVDIGPLLYHFVRAELESLGKPELLQPVDADQPWISAATVARLARYHWPGNVRELRNVIRQLVIAGRFQSEVSLGTDLEALLRPLDSATTHAISQQAVELQAQETLEPGPHNNAARYRAPGEVDEDELLRTLRAHGYRLAPTAKALNLSRTSLYALVEQSSRIRKAADLDSDEINDALAKADGKLTEAAMTLEVSAHALKLRMRALGLSD